MARKSQFCHSISISFYYLSDMFRSARQGSKGLSLFFLRVKQDDNTLNNIQINRMKNKMGTKGLPTAELILNGSRALLVSQPGRGDNPHFLCLSIHLSLSLSLTRCF